MVSCGDSDDTPKGLLKSFIKQIDKGDYEKAAEIYVHNSFMHVVAKTPTTDDLAKEINSVRRIKKMTIIKKGLFRGHKEVAYEHSIGFNRATIYVNVDTYNDPGRVTFIQYEGKWYFDLVVW
jgi:chromosome segregation ATPase